MFIRSSLFLFNHGSEPGLLTLRVLDVENKYADPNLGTSENCVEGSYLALLHPIARGSANEVAAIFDVAHRFDIPCPEPTRRHSTRFRR